MKPFLSLALLSTFYIFPAAAGELSLDCILRGSCVSTQNVVDHLKSLQEIAAKNNGNRAAGTSGHEMSANYVAQQLLIAGYKVELSPFSFTKFSKISSSLCQLAPLPASYQEEKEYQVMNYSGSGLASSEVVPVDLTLGSGNTSSSGCGAEDFLNFPPGKIALIQRGTCSFQQKVENAQTAGASGIILFNQGNSPDREEVFSGTLSEDSKVHIPVVASTKVEKKISYNVLAETSAVNPDNVVMIGAHLDSVPEGAGINDNGSGSAAILEVALSMKNTKTNNKVRFAWFSAEVGLVGSTRYVEGLTEAEKK